jgi:hypothetical protein
VAQPLDLNFSLAVGWRLRKSNWRPDQTADNEAERKNSASNEASGASAKHVFSFDEYFRDDR